jgi:2-keto-4-pentenoate hydratase/2-oxohepta-3-ene-1,7-dioic acid hydratase in catechol pathway
MKFVRFEHEGFVKQGVVKGEEVVAIRGSFFREYEETEMKYGLSRIKILPPVVPSKIVCIGLNYLEHIEEVGARVPEKPHIFLKPPSCLIGHEDAIVIPRWAERVDYEGELAVVINEKMKDVPESEALSYVLGCSCFNDVTERAVVFENISNLILAKGFDTFGAFGPYLVTQLDPNQLEVKTYLNGVLMQHGHTSKCVFNIQKILHYVSTVMTLFPGDVVITGTPKGIAPMKSGDVVEVEVGGVGTLRNTVRAQDPLQ